MFILLLYEVYKNWVVFFELIVGCFVVLYGILLGIMIDYYEVFDFDVGEYIVSYYVCFGCDDVWDNCLCGVGLLLIKMLVGWLLFYYVMDWCDFGCYKFGVMLLDLYDFCCILGWLLYLLFELDVCYENDGFKLGVIYVCGVVVSGGLLYVYYGGVDIVVCVGIVLLDSLLVELFFVGWFVFIFLVWRFYDYFEMLFG